ncbi:NADH-ubiquinone oxidoreductase chain C [hydrothermal vent metagenome]|uniref:NADH-ubiquinone oxidoreductase chain C n=1 Tax=hydrothermal vent metagenome TaxID=652676 RepID=A0A3B1D3L2_9ZZZZ
MKTPEEIFEILKAEFQDAVIEIDSELPVEPIIIVDPLAINKIAQFLRVNEELQFDSLMNLSGVDDANGEKITEEDGTVTIKGGTFSVYYHLHSTTIDHKVMIRVIVDKDKPEVESVDPVWKASTWHEREAYDMYGIIFLNHPDLRRILLPDDWDGYPLRKDYENPEYYDGMKIPY